MRTFLIGITIACALALSACSERSTAANPTAFCTAAKESFVTFSALSGMSNPTPADAKAYAASLTKLEGIAPEQIESAIKKSADTWNQFVKTGDQNALEGEGYAAAVSQINAWESQFCK